MSQQFQFRISKNKLKWAGDLEGLKLFLSDELGVNGKWKSPSGGTWKFSSEHLNVTWYVKSQTISFQGPRGDQVYKEIKKTAEKQITDQKCSTIDSSPTDSAEHEDEAVDVDNVEFLENESKSVAEGDQISCPECRSLSIDVAEMKLDLALLSPSSP